jgi:hypothetical protein
MGLKKVPKKCLTKQEAYLSGKTGCGKIHLMAREQKTRG